MSKNSMAVHWGYLKRDFVGEMNFVVNKVIDVVLDVITSMLCRLNLSMGGVKYGKRLRSRGLMMVRRFQCSTIEIGDDCKFNSSSRYNFRGLNHRCILQTGQEGAVIRIGNGCGLSGVSIVADSEVIIEDHVTIGANTLIGDRDGHPDRLHTTAKPIRIGHHTFIGMNSMVMKGVTIGEHSIIGAGSIVTKDIPANCIAVGSPCKVIKQID